MDDEPNQPLVDVQNVGLRFAGMNVLNGVDLAVRKGEIVTLIGPNGSGKTTLTRVVLGLLAPDSGRVVRRPGLVVGYLPQRFSVDPVLPLTVSRLMTLTHSCSRAKIDDALAVTGVTQLIKANVAELSGGELQRVLLARALLREPHLLVLDEPTQGVDFAGEAEFYGLISKLRDQLQCGVLMISHNLHMVMSSTDSVVCLNHHVCCSGKPEAVKQNPEFLALFGPSAVEHVALYTHDHDHSHDVSGAVIPLADDEQAHIHGHGHRHGDL
jgi:zinc transport system ATP-binding protein